LVNSCRFFF